MRAWIVIVGLLTTGVAHAADIGLAYENFYRDEKAGRARIVIRVTNNTARPQRSIFAECAFLNSEKRALDVATLIASNVAPGSSAVVAGWSAQMPGIEHAECRISNYN